MSVKFKHIDPDILRLLAVVGEAGKLVQIKKVAENRLACLGVTAEGAEPFVRLVDEPLEVTLNAAGIIDWINSVNLPVRGDAAWIAEEKQRQLGLFRSLIVTLRSRLGVS